MGGLGIAEILLFSGIALLFFGPSRLPSLGRALGKTISNFKKGLHEINNNEASKLRNLPESGQSSLSAKSKG